MRKFRTKILKNKENRHFDFTAAAAKILSCVGMIYILHILHMYFDPTQHVLPNTQKIYIYTPPKSKKGIVFRLLPTTNVLCEVITKEY